MTSMAVAIKQLDIEIGDLVEVAGRRYDVVSDNAGGIALEPAITVTIADIHAADGSRPLTAEEFQQHFGDLPVDDEG